MKIIFLKSHLNFKEGDSTEVPDGLGIYLKAVGVAKESEKEKVEKKEETEKEEFEDLPTSSLDIEKVEIKKTRKKKSK